MNGCSTPFGIIGIFTAWVPRHVGSMIYELLFGDRKFLPCSQWDLACKESLLSLNLFQVKRMLTCKYLKCIGAMVSLCITSIFRDNQTLKAITSVDTC